VIIVGSTFATDADFALHCIPGSPWRATIGYSWTVLIWTIMKKGPRARRALGPLHFIEPTWTVFKLKPAWLEGEARRAEAKFWVWFFCEGTGTNCEACDLNFGTAQVIMRKGVSKGTNTSCCHPVSVSELSPWDKTVLPTSWIQRLEGYFWMTCFGTKGDEIGLLFARCWRLLGKNLATMQLVHAHQRSVEIFTKNCFSIDPLFSTCRWYPAPRL